MAIFDPGFPLRLATAAALMGASLVVLIVMSAGVSCGFPDPGWVFSSFLFFFAVGFIWTVAELMRPRVLALPVALGVYFSVGPVGLAIARSFFPRAGKVHDESDWMPMWTIGLFLATELLPGSC